MSVSGDDDGTERELWEKLRSEMPEERRSACPDRSALAAYLDGRTSARERRLAEEHFASCPDCCENLKELRDLLTAPPLAPPVSVRKRAKGLISAEIPAEKEGLAPLNEWLRILFPSWRHAVGWAMACVVLVFACAAGYMMGRGTPVLRRSIKASDPTGTGLDGALDFTRGAAGEQITSGVKL